MCQEGPVRGEFGSRLKGLYARQDMMAEFWHRQKEAFALRSKDSNNGVLGPQYYT